MIHQKHPAFDRDIPPPPPITPIDKSGTPWPEKGFGWRHIYTILLALVFWGLTMGFVAFLIWSHRYFHGQ